MLSLLEEKLERVRQHLQNLDLIEEKLIRIRALAEMAADDGLTAREIEAINREVKLLEEQIDLLNLERNLQA